MRVFSIQGSLVGEVTSLSSSMDELCLPEQGFSWLTCTRDEFELRQVNIQALLQRLCYLQLVDLHTADLLNEQLPSHYDYTSLYDVLVFHRLIAVDAQPEPSAKRSLPPILRRIDTSPVGFVVLDRVLLSVHPQNCSMRDAYAHRLLTTSGDRQTPLTLPDSRSTGARGIPGNPADLMLRIVNYTVDGFLALRRELSDQLDHWQAELLNPKTRFNNWSALLNARLFLHQLDNVCEDQHSAIQNWMEALKTWPDSDTTLNREARDMLQVRSRDVLEHIARVANHVHRLEQSLETAVQMHFSAQSHRTNEIMRTLTALTAIFLPLNLIAGIFGMNFEFIPMLHRSNGFWLTLTTMALIASTLVLFFWRKRYLTRTGR